MMEAIYFLKRLQQIELKKIKPDENNNRLLIRKEE